MCSDTEAACREASHPDCLQLGCDCCWSIHPPAAGASAGKPLVMPLLGASTVEVLCAAGRLLQLNPWRLPRQITSCAATFNTVLAARGDTTITAAAGSLCRAAAGGLRIARAGLQATAAAAARGLMVNCICMLLEARCYQTAARVCTALISPTVTAAAAAGRTIGLAATTAAAGAAARVNRCADLKAAAIAAEATCAGRIQ